MRWVRTLLAGSAGLCLLGLAGTVKAQGIVSPNTSEPTIITESAPVNADAPGTVIEMAEPGHGHGGHFQFLEGGPVDWKKVPPVRIFPRPGNFFIPPSGEGYYSVRDVIEGEYRKAPPKFPYPPFALMSPSFFDADFRYLDNPKNTQHDIFDPLHRIHIGDNWLFNTGGQAWYRYMNETNSRLSGVNNNYDLMRLRVYGDLWYKDAFRVYVEFVAATSVNENLPPLAIDENFADLQNAFIDVKLPGGDDHPAYLRVGRQELLLGSQRLISPPDWANVRRTFNGVRAFRQGEKFDVDLFLAQPVTPNARRFDSVDNNQNFGGIWTTYRPKKGTFLDMYYLFLDNTNPVVQQGIVRAPYTLNTVGSRFTGDQEGWLWDVEGMYQWGDRGAASICAGAFTVGAGKNWKDNCWNPTAWIYYDYASGDRDPNSGNFTTFNQLFPFGHYYFGWLDLIGRQNICDLNMHLYLYPTKWLTMITQFHHFSLDSAKDALYNPAGAATRRDPTGRAGNNIGNEIDLIFNVHVGPHSDILFGYSHLFAGGFVTSTGPAASRGDAELAYIMYNFRW